jgi:hypothetical protein
MHQSSIKYAGKEPENVLYGLMGGKDYLDKLFMFLGSPALYATYQYAYESLFAPTTVSSCPNDKQISQIRSIINTLKQDNKIIRILDYGAGQGRLISSIMDNQDNPSEIKSWLDYIAYDKSKNDKKTCEDAISRVYGDSINRYFNDENNLLGYKNGGSLNIVIMCNLLHEVSPKDWKNIFKKGSPVNELLAENGYVFIIEDTQIPFGEKPNKDGFFILGRTELKTLFNINVDDPDFITESHNDENRLFAHLIPKKYITNITDDTVKKALNKLKDKCKTQIEQLRDKNDYRSGRLLGLWLQQLANIVLYLE